MKKLIDPATLIAHIKEAEDTAGVSFAQHIVKEYLDKIPEEKSDAVEFAEWVSENYVPYMNRWTHPSDTSFNYSTEELYSLFKQ